MDYVEGRAANEAGRISGEELLELERSVMPGSGTCGAMFTANTMSTIAEAIGMMLPRGASHPADYDAKSDIHADVRAQARASVDAPYRLIKAACGRGRRDEHAFENAIATVYAMGGSTNMYLHLLAIAREAQVPIEIERIQQIGERIPLISNLQPHGPYAMASLHAIGGVPVVMKELLRAGLLHGDAMTVTGKTLADLAEVPTLEQMPRQDIVFPVARPVAAPNNHISVLKGDLRARKLPAETQRQDAGERTVPRHCQGIPVRSRYDEGHPRRPDRARHRRRRAQRGAGRWARHARDGDAHHPVAGARPRRECRLDHRRSLLGRQPRNPDRAHLAGSRTRRSDCGGPRRRHDRHRSRRPDPQPDVSDAEIARRMAEWRAPDQAGRVRPGSVHDKYIRLVSSAHHGCVV